MNIKKLASEFNILKPTVRKDDNGNVATTTSEKGVTLWGGIKLSNDSSTTLNWTLRKTYDSIYHAPGHAFNAIKNFCGHTSSQSDSSQENGGRGVEMVNTAGPGSDFSNANLHTGNSSNQSARAQVTSRTGSRQANLPSTVSATSLPAQRTQPFWANVVSKKGSNASSGSTDPQTKEVKVQTGDQTIKTLQEREKQLNNVEEESEDLRDGAQKNLALTKQLTNNLNQQNTWWGVIGLRRKK